MLDALTYAGIDGVARRLPTDRVDLRRGRRRRRRRWSTRWSPTHDVVVHFAAESHNDNSLDDPGPFVDTNLVGTFTLLEAVRRHDKRLPPHLHRRGLRRPRARRPERSSPRTRRTTRRSPYSVDQGRLRPAGAGLGALASACRRRSRTARTTTAPASTSRSSSRARSPTSSTASGPSSTAPGSNVRDWIHVDDHNVGRARDPRARAGIGETYLIGADGEKQQPRGRAR